MPCKSLLWTKYSLQASPDYAIARLHFVCCQQSGLEKAHFFIGAEAGMADSDIYGKVTELVQPILDSLGLELVELEFKKVGRSFVLRLFIDKRAV